ncbi:MAG: AarF/ABC1/UbiB kinase family protein [Acidobacteria bacterium]|nr:MAG: AarF/ABC1/UbiB kinase family protein [Acidobacteriota bacterium]
MIQPLSAVRTYRRLKRYRQVTFTLAKYGFGDVADRIGFSSLLKRRLKGKAKPAVSPTPQRFRTALVELGPTFVKFGQLLSTRPDILPERYIRELEKLQDDVQPFPYNEVRAVLREELKNDPEGLFEDFEQTPFAAGSIAQVHKARTPAGAVVAVKVQRPGIPRLIEIDLHILADLARLIEKHIPELRWLQPGELVEQFARTIRRELDFLAEAQSTERFRRNFKDDPTRYIPAVHWEFTSARVLATDWVDGVKVTNVADLEARGFDRKEVARNGARAILKEVFEHRLFHADPHPGNFFVIANNAIATVDFGIVGRLDDETADQLGLLLTSILDRDADAVLQVFRNLNLLNDEVDEALLRFDIEEFIDRYYGLPLQRLDIQTVIGSLLEMVRRHRIILPMNLALLGRMLAVASGVGQTLDPEFSIIDEAAPFVRSFLIGRADPRKAARRLLKTWRQYSELIRSLPSDVEEIAAKLKKGELSVSLHHEGLARLIQEIDRSSNRLAFAMIVAALIIGSSLLVLLQQGPEVLGIPALGLAGYLIAGLLGLWLVVAILRSGRI